MEVHYLVHAKEVTNHFKKMLSDEQLAMMEDELFDDLETLIEAALGVIDSQAKHAAAKSVEALAHQLRKEAGSVRT